VAQPPQIACPADVTVKSVSGTSQAVTYPDPTVTLGAPPVTTSCSPASSTSFPLGTTPVRCTARDAQAREATCSFNVTLSGFTLAAKKFDAFGDSLTAGENGLPSFVDPPNSYPTKLQASLDAYYPGQGIAVINRGEPGQPVERTLAVIPSLLSTDRPDAALLLTGYNNLTTPCGPGLASTKPCRDAIDFVAFGVRDCIRRIKESPVGVKFVFVSTLTPPGPTGSRRIDRNAILDVNGRIRQMIAAERVTLVDSYPVFIGHETEYVSPDGLHLLPPGYQALADTFFAAIRTTVPQSPQLSIQLR
jgi:lysophospholipase L1-like esterase